MSIAEQVSSFNFHSFTSHLDKTCKERYQEKCKKLGMGLTDPYSIPFAMCLALDASTLTNTDHGHGKAADLSDLGLVVPNIEYPDLFNYLVCTTSVFTGKQLKAYKSLEAYKYFVAGWVCCVRQWRIYQTRNFMIFSKVGLPNFYF